jgi:hypothetical protein
MLMSDNGPRLQPLSVYSLLANRFLLAALIGAAVSVSLIGCFAWPVPTPQWKCKHVEVTHGVLLSLLSLITLQAARNVLEGGGAEQ